jgi:hypothetical protein
MPKRERVMPTGECWDGCGAEVARGSFFAIGHDRRAEGMLIKMEYGGVAEFLAAKGYAPDEKNLLKAFEEWRRRNEKR